MLLLIFSFSNLQVVALQGYLAHIRTLLRVFDRFKLNKAIVSIGRDPHCLNGCIVDILKFAHRQQRRIQLRFQVLSANVWRKIPYIQLTVYFRLELGRGRCSRFLLLVLLRDYCLS
jgi:hypothetical protein